MPRSGGPFAAVQALRDPVMGHDRPVRIEVTQPSLDGPPGANTPRIWIEINDDGNMHTFTLEAASKLHQMLGIALEYARDTSR